MRDYYKPHRPPHWQEYYEAQREKERYGRTPREYPSMTRRDPEAFPERREFSDRSRQRDQLQRYSPYEPRDRNERRYDTGERERYTQYEPRYRNPYQPDDYSRYGERWRANEPDTRDHPLDYLDEEPGTYRGSQGYGGGYIDYRRRSRGGGFIGGSGMRGIRDYDYDREY